MAATGVKYSDNATTTLDLAINAACTSLTLVDVSTFPGGNTSFHTNYIGAANVFFATISSADGSTEEVVKVTGLNRSTRVATVVRGQTTDAKSFSSGATFEIRMGKSLLSQFTTNTYIQTNYASNSTMRQLVANTMQVGNVNSLLASKANTSFVTDRISSVSNTVSQNTAALNAKIAIRANTAAVNTLVRDRMQVANVVSRDNKYLEVANVSGFGFTSNTYAKGQFLSRTQGAGLVQGVSNTYLTTNYTTNDLAPSNTYLQTFFTNNSVGVTNAGMRTFAISNTTARTLFVRNDTNDVIEGSIEVGQSGVPLRVRSNDSNGAKIRFDDTASNIVRGFIGATSSYVFTVYNSGGTEVINVDSSGNLIADGNLTAYSDESLKDNISTIDNALDKVKNLTGVTYNMKSSGERGVGLIAQNVQKVIPEAVLQSEETKLLSLAYGNLVGVLVEAIKELESRVEELENDG